MASSRNVTRSAGAERLDELVAMVRAYVPVPVRKTRAAKSRNGAPASDYTFVFDTETTANEAQSLRFGAYQLRQKGDLVEHGFSTIRKASRKESARFWRKWRWRRALS